MIGKRNLEQTTDKFIPNDISGYRKYIGKQ